MPAAARRPSAAGPEPRAAANFVRAARRVSELRSAAGPGGGCGDGTAPLFLSLSLSARLLVPAGVTKPRGVRAGRVGYGTSRAGGGSRVPPQSFHRAGRGARAPGGRRWRRGEPRPGALPAGGAVARDGRAARGSKPGRSRGGRGVWREMGNNASEQLEEVIVKESWELLRGQLRRAL